jgi:HEAT repeat protein
VAIQQALAQLIQDERADPTARLEATKAALSIGEISGDLADSIALGLGSKNRNVRIGCTRAAAGLITKISDANQKEKVKTLADKLAELVQYEPEKDWNHTTPTAEEAKAIRGAVHQASTAKEEGAAAAIQALLALGDSIEPFVREASAQATDHIRRRLETVLTELQERRWANDSLVRQAAAQALSQIGLISTIPALIETLEDNEATVRNEANRALVAITTLDFGYESDPDVRDPVILELQLSEEEKASIIALMAQLRSEKDPEWEAAAKGLWEKGHKTVSLLRATAVEEKVEKYRRRMENVLTSIERKPCLKMDESTKHAQQIKIRQEGVAKWKAWWDETKGISILVDRFWTFQSKWTSYSVADLFDQALFLKKASAASMDPERANRIFQSFQTQKNVFVADAVAVGVDGMKLLFSRMDGKCALERVYSKLGEEQKQSLLAKSRSATRLFLAEVLQQLPSSEEKVSALLSMLSDERGAAAAATLGLLGEAEVGTAGCSALESALRSRSNEDLREAAANALRRLGVKSSVPALTDVATSASQESSADQPKVRSAIAALRALAALKISNPQVLSALGDMISDETPGGKKALVDLLREYACEALGEIGSPESLESLVRARRDTKRSVQLVAAESLRKIYARESGISRTLVTFLKTKIEALDRIGAALALGDLQQETRVHDLVGRIVDRNPPRDLRDFDPAVRAAVCRALGAIKSKTQISIEALLQAMADPAEEVRQEAYFALRDTVGAETAAQQKLPVREAEGKNPEHQEFKGSYEESDRRKFLDLWKRWYEGQKGSFKKEPDKEI